MKKTTINISGQIELSYDENSPEFTQALEDYRHCCDKTATAEDMLKHVAFHVTRFGTETMVEGVGCVGFNGKKPFEDYCGIMVGEDYDDFNFEIR